MTCACRHPRGSRACRFALGPGVYLFFFFFSSRRRHTRSDCDWSSDVCSSDLRVLVALGQTVRTGQPVAVFTSPQLYEARRALLEAESQSRLARQALTRDQALHEDGIIAASRWQATQARAAEAAAMAQARRAELDRKSTRLNSSHSQISYAVFCLKKKR